MVAAWSFFTCNDFSVKTGLVTGFLLNLISPLLTVQFRYDSRSIVNLHQVYMQGTLITLWDSS